MFPVQVTSLSLRGVDPTLRGNMHRKHLRVSPYIFSNIKRGNLFVISSRYLSLSKKKKKKVIGIFHVNSL